MSQSLNDTVLTTIREHLTSARIDHVELRRDFDEYGDPLLWITVVLASDPKAMDSKELVGIVGRLRAALESSNETAFPVPSFTTIRDHKRLKHAAA